MNINLIKLKGIVQALYSIDRNISRIADCMEFDAIERGLKEAPPSKTPIPQASIDYEDEELTFAKESIPGFAELYERDVQRTSNPKALRED